MTQNIVELCQARGWSAERLAQECGLDPMRVQAIYQARWTPSPSERQRIAAAFQVTVEAISWGHATPIQHIYGHGPG